MPTSTRVVEYVKKKLKEGGDQTCRIYYVTTSIVLFKRPFLTMCKSCAATKSSEIIKCDVCNKIVKYGNYSKHKKTKSCASHVVAQIAEESNEANCEANFAPYGFACAKVHQVVEEVCDDLSLYPDS
jgi:hypothetical protein